jgi:hypothetical protein
MKDILGNTLEVGDKVVFGTAQSMRLMTGIISKIHLKTVMIKHEEYRNGCYSEISESRRNFEDVVKINP